MKNIDRALSLLAGKEASGAAIFDVATEALTLALGCRWAGVVARTSDDGAPRLLAYRADGERVDIDADNIRGLPSELFREVVSEDSHCLVSEGLGERYPQLKTVTASGVTACRGEQFLTSDGAPAGHVFVMDDKTMADDAETRTLFRLVSQRVGAEFDRLQSEHALQASEARFRNLVEGSIEGIAVYRDWSVLFANDAYARILGHDSSAAIIGSDLRDHVAEKEMARLGRLREARLGGQTVSGRYEFEVIHKDGRHIIVDCAVSLVEWDGEPAIQVAMTDISDQKAAREAVRDREERYRNLMDGSVQGILVRRGEQVLFANETAARIYGCDGVPEFIAWYDRRKVTPPEEWTRVHRLVSTALRERPEVPVRYDLEVRRKDDSPMWLEVATRFVDWSGERVTQVTFVEITERVLAARALKRSEQRFRDLAEVSADWFWEMDADLRFTYVSDRLFEIVDTSRDEVLGKTRMELAGADQSDETWRRHVADLEARREVRDFRYPWTLGDGSTRYWSISGKPVFDERGVFRGYRGAGTDVTEQVQAEAVLRESADRIRDFAEATSDWFWETDAEHRVAHLSEAPKGWDEAAVEQRLGRSRFDFEAFDDDPEKWRRHREDLAARRPFRDFRYKRETPDGSIQHASISGRPFFGLDGAFLGYRGTGIDVTAEVAARTQLSDAIESLADGVIIFDGDDRIVVFNQRYRETYAGISDLLVPGTPFVDVLRAAAKQGLVPDAVGREDEWLRERLDFHDRAQGLMEQRLADGRWLQITERRTENGYTVSIRTDITERRLQEEQLRQSQKMEAVGQLTGGIAHDFNNLLAIIQGNITHLDRQIEATSPLKALTEPALRAAKRGAALTHRLLAFSRRQSLDVQEVGIDELLAGMQDLLLRSLGEDVRLDLLPADGLWPCLVDPGQLEQAILNLAINARDAMAEGGVLIIETANAALAGTAAARAGVAPGDYIVIAVTDSGMGMSEEVKERIFEPFFTTKEVGRGTGLGLSMAFGFARQSQGHLTVYSEVGLGSTFRLYLPRATGERPATSEAVPPTRTATTMPRGRGETILVVEDDADVRRMASMLLEEFGYRVREADSGGAAMQILEESGPFDLLLSDVVLPGGVTGQGLAEFARKHYPELKVLFMSGYIRDDVAAAEHGDFDAPLLPKPFEPEDLARSVASLIGEF